MKGKNWEEILRKTSVKEDPWLEKEVYKFLRKMERSDGVLVGEKEIEEFSDEVIISALQKGYVNTEIAPESCPPELDRITLTKKGKKYLKSKKMHGCMEGINLKLYQGLRNELKDEFDFRSSDLGEIKDFMKSINFEERQRIAQRLIGHVLARHGKDNILRFVNRLAQVEYKIRELEPWVRDHVVHAFLTFMLGIYVGKNLIPNKFSQKSIKFQWKLAGSLHDIGYPIQIAHNLGKYYVQDMNKILKEIRTPTPKLKHILYLENLEKLNDDKNAFDLISKKLQEWDVNIDPKEHYDSLKSRGDVDHGVISSLSILKVVDALYKKYNPERAYKRIIKENLDWNMKFFDRDVVSAASAVFLHNIQGDKFENNSTKITFKKAPIAYFTVLCDILQEWERPKKDFRGYPATDFDIEFDKGCIIYMTDIPKEKRKKMVQELESKIEGFKVKITTL